MKSGISVLLLVIAFAAGASESGGRYTSADLGMSIQVPAAGAADPEVYQVAFFLLPAEDGFAANVNIQRQRYEGSIESYRAVSEEQMKAAGFSMLSISSKGNELRMEYAGMMQERKLHWYARAVSVPPYVYLITATSLDGGWGKQKQELVKSVESFQKF